MTPELYRLAWTTMLGSALRFREMYYRDDLEIIKGFKAPSADSMRTKGTRSLTQKAVDKKHREHVNKLIDEVESINRRIYKEVEKGKSLSPENADKLDNFIDHVTICMEEIISSRDPKQVAAILKLNNQGLFDEIFKQVINETSEQKTGQDETVAADTEQ